MLRLQDRDEIVPAMMEGSAIERHGGSRLKKIVEHRRGEALQNAKVG